METGIVQAGSVNLQFFANGNGPTLMVLVHGYTMSGRVWRLVQEALDPNQFRTIALSNRGAGESSHSAHEADYSVGAFARDLFAAIETLDLHDIVLVGHSMGGATVAQFALDHPDRLKSLVLLDPAPLTGRVLPDGWEEQVRERHRNKADVVRIRDREDLGNAPADFVEPLVADVARNPVERLLGGRRSMGTIHLRERLPELRMPVLVVGGDRDVTVGVDNILAEYLALAPDVRSLHVFHGVGHSPNVQVAAELARVLEQFGR